MEIREISFFQSFSCLEGACPQTCCKGWLIPLTDEDRERFRQEKGILKARLFLATCGGLKEFFNTDSATCPFLTRKGLCSMQLKKGHDYLPETCRSYPRFYRNYGEWEERLIDLSCIAGARLWFENAQNLTFVTKEGEAQSPYTYTNEDRGFLRSLVTCRSAFVKSLLCVKTLEDLRDTLAKIDAYALSAQSAYLAGETDFLTRHPFGSWVYPEDAVSAADEAPAPPERIFPFSSPTYLDLLHTHFYAERLSYANPVLHHLCRLCLDESERAFPQKWEAASATFLKDHADYIPYYASLFAYYLCQYFLRTFEDYSFRRNIRSGLIYINMKFFFDALFSQEKGGFDDECFAAVLSAYSKRAFFSEEILDEMYTALEKRKATL